MKTITAKQEARTLEIKSFLKSFIIPEVRVYHYENAFDVVKVKIPNCGDAWFPFVCDVMNTSNEAILEGLKDEAKRQCLILSTIFK